jgi:hypothetical protein
MEWDSNPLRWSGPTRNWAPITEVMLNPKKHKSEPYGELTIDTATAAQKPAASAMSNTVKQISNAGGDSSKNSFHKCPITNASDAGEGLPMPKNKLSDELRRSPLPSSKLRVEGTTAHPPLENLT